MNQFTQFFQVHKTQVKAIAFWLKIIFTCILLYFLFTRIRLEETFKLMLQLPVKIVLLILLTTILKFFSQVWNWELVLKIDPGFKESWSKIIKTHFIGLYLKLIIPGGYGTFGKMAFINQHQKKATFLSILAEKFFQNWISLFFGVLSLLFIMKTGKELWTFLLILVSASPFLIPLIFKNKGTKELWRSYNDKIPYLMLSQYIHQFLTFFQYWLLFNSFIKVSFINICKGISVALLSTILPISYSGLGIRETAMIVTFNSYSVPAEISVAVSLLIFFYNSVLPVIPGIYYFFMINKRK